jgi:hypothetical protein
MHFNAEGSKVKEGRRENPFDGFDELPPSHGYGGHSTADELPPSICYSGHGRVCERPEAGGQQGNPFDKQSMSEVGGRKSVKGGLYSTASVAHVLNRTNDYSSF